MQELIPFSKKTAMISSELVKSKSRFTVSELSILLCSLGGIRQSKEWDGRWVEVTPQEYGEFRGVSLRTAKEMLEEARMSLWNKYVEIKTPDSNKIQMIRIINRMDKEITSTFRFQFNEDFVPLICELKKYITCDLKSIGKISSYSSYKLYFLFRELTLYKKQLDVSFSLEELSELLGITGKYQVFAELSREVLKPSLKELKDKLGANIEMNYIKDGRKVIGLHFKGTVK